MIDKDEDEDYISEKVHEAENILKWFYKILIEPIIKHLSPKLIIIPHKYLHLIPFNALKGDKFLLRILYHIICSKCIFITIFRIFYYKRII